jgi:DNA-binding HxlR family transcriptional regulator
MTGNSTIRKDYTCPAEDVLKILAGKWRPQIFKLVWDAPARFNHILRELPQANKQSISTALHEMEEAGMITKNIITRKPLHIEYAITQKGRDVAQVYKYLSPYSNVTNANEKSTC